MSSLLNVCSNAADIYSDVVDFLYWEVYYDICYEFKDAYELLFYIIASLFLLVVLCAPAIRFSHHTGVFMKWLFNGAEQSRIEDAAEKGQSVGAAPAVAPTPAPTTPTSPSPQLRSESLMYPPPFEFPFKNFRGTGESFAPSRRYYAEQRLQFSPPVLYKTIDSWEDAQNEGKQDVVTAQVPVIDKPAVRIETDSAEKQVPVSPVHEELPSPPQPRPATPPVPRTDNIPQSSSATVVQAPSHSYEPTPVQVPVVPYQPDPETIRLNALTLVAQQESKIEEQMYIFLRTVSTGAGYEVSAALILDFMLEARQYLEQFFPGGLDSLPVDYRPWRGSIVAFWEALAPYGWDFLHHLDSRVPEFLRRFRNFAIWFGLEELLIEFQFNEPCVPEPVLAPTEAEPRFQEQLAEVQPQVHEQPGVAQIFSTPAVLAGPLQSPSHAGTEVFSTPAAEKPQPPRSQPTQQPKPTQATSTFAMPKTSSPFNAGNQIPAVAALATSSKTPVTESPFPPPQQPVKEPIPAPGPFTFTMTPAPTSGSYTKGNKKPKTPSRAPKPSQPSQSAKQPTATLSNPNLLNFDNPDWYKKPENELNALSWTSFTWASPAQAAYKIWSYSTVGRLELPPTKTKKLTSKFVKTALESIAADFKRACVVLRLQARDCKQPCEDDVGMAPLLGEVMRMMDKAAEYTERCDEVAIWDAQDQWYHACLYFRDAVRLDKAVWETLCGYYGPEKYRPLRQAWKQGSAEWLLLDA